MPYNINSSDYVSIPLLVQFLLDKTVEPVTGFDCIMIFPPLHVDGALNNADCQKELLDEAHHTSLN